VQASHSCRCFGSQGAAFLQQLLQRAATTADEKGAAALQADMSQLCPTHEGSYVPTFAAALAEHGKNAALPK
jgi:hypothetical protein